MNELWLLMGVLCAFGSGVATCHVFHQQRGLEMDSWSDVVRPVPDKEYVDA
jgi:hypothetical protein